MAVDASPSALAALRDHAPDEPVVMLNLLRFAPGGRDTYADYMRGAAPFLQQYGGELVYAGEAGDALVAEEGQEWDAVLVIRYVSRDAFVRMVSDPGYQEVSTLRGRALSEAVLQPTVPWRGRGER
ncbi:DUF1330 domain-containing protein [Isoptericola chiayiensis]|uniref:DUF1330 domain-containing protein n=1 Tax=Isoptericola chiayiensis TaxID=579446 RepID=A0ABP8YNJ0_9MICO|nr:DUF1330 domain-containing protein [Isoptericola chiayiensis]NOW02234.1 uncharacterized protein (DUF1330 family) [Isoptericola chiayiensis]